MRITVVRLLTQDQTIREIRHFERYRCMPEDALRRGKISNEEFERWKSLLHALEAYKEGEGIEAIIEEKFSSTRLLSKILTVRRIELLEQIRLGVGSITELAKRVGPRDMKNVHDDLQLLKSLGFISLERDGKRVVPRLLLSSIYLHFR